MKEPDVTRLIDERREWLRVDDRLLLEYRVVGEGPGSVLLESSVSDEEAITTFITKPTEDLLSHSSASEAESLLIPWLRKVDWVLELVLHRLVYLSKQPIVLPRPTTVNISGGGISFYASRSFQVGDHLDLRLILPPFSPIQARVEVTQLISARDQVPVQWCVATRFVLIDQDDHERLIRHIIHVQAERLRARHLSEVTAD